MKLKTTFNVVILIIGFSCSTGQKNDIQVIDIGSNFNWKVTNLSSFAENIRYIPLETIESLTLSGIVDAVVSDNMILVSDRRNCLLYDFKGNFIAKIGNKGRGPGEYQYLSNIGIGFGPDPKIYVSSLYDIYEYNTNGVFINKYVKSLSINDTSAAFRWSIIHDSLFFGHIPNNTGKVELKAIIKDKYGNVKHTFKNYDLFSRDHDVASGFENNVSIYQFKDSIFYKEFFNDTLFYLNNQYGLVSKYVFDLGKFKLQIPDRVKLSGEIIYNHLFIWYVFQTEDHLFINCQFGNYFPAKRITPKAFGPTIALYNTTYGLGIYDKKSKELYFCKPTSTDNPLFTSGIYNDIDAGPRFFPNMQINDSTLVMWIAINELKDHIKSDDFKDNVSVNPEKKNRLKKLADSLSILDNPVLMFVTFKKKN
jgi:hypothetical protein